MSGALRLAFTLEAIDKATATVAKVNARIDKLTEPARKVRAAFTSLIRESRLERIGDAADNVGARMGELNGQVMGVVTGVAAVGAVATTAFLGVKRIADEVDQLGDAAKMLGISTQELQRMGYAAQLNGASVDKLTDSLRFLSTNMIEARNGNAEMVMWFKRVGISAQQLEKMNVLQVFEQISDTFKRVGDTGQNSAKKIAVMKAMLGRSGPELKQLMDIGAPALRAFYEEADRMGVVLEENTVDSMASFNDQWDRMRASVFGVMATALGAAAPLLERVMLRITEWTAANKGLIATRFSQWVDKVADRLPDILKGVSDVAGGLGAMFGAVNRVAELLGGWPNLLAVIAGLMGLQMVVSIGQLSVAVWGLNAALLTNPFGMTLLAVSSLVALLPLLVLHWDKVIAKAQQFNAAIPEWMKKVSPLAMGFNSMVTALAPAAPTGNAVPTTLPAQQFGRTEVGGTLRITIGSDGQARVAELAKTPYSPLDIAVDSSYLGGMMPAGR